MAKNKLQLWNPYSWIIFTIFFFVGVLNMILIHHVPGFIYILISLIYLPPLSNYIKVKLLLSIPIILKVILAILVIWFTLGVSDLMQIFESKFLH
jgi:hypothetical protein